MTRARAWNSTLCRGRKAPRRRTLYVWAVAPRAVAEAVRVAAEAAVEGTAAEAVAAVAVDGRETTEP